MAQKAETYTTQFASLLQEELARVRKRVDNDELVVNKDAVFQATFNNKLQSISGPRAGFKNATEDAEAMEDYAEIDRNITKFLRLAKDLIKQYESACAKVEEAKPKGGFGKQWQIDLRKLSHMLEACSQITKARIDASLGSRAESGMVLRSTKIIVDKQTEHEKQDDLEAERLLDSHETNKQQSAIRTDMHSFLRDVEKAVSLLAKHLPVKA